MKIFTEELTDITLVSEDNFRRIYVGLYARRLHVHQWRMRRLGFSSRGARRVRKVREIRAKENAIQATSANHTEDADEPESCTRNSG